jgi:hypothetical protein
MPVETRLLRLRQPVALGHRIDGWCVCWLAGWDRHRIFYVVMVSRVKAEAECSPQIINKQNAPVRTRAGEK